MPLPPLDTRGLPPIARLRALILERLIAANERRAEAALDRIPAVAAAIRRYRALSEVTGMSWSDYLTLYREVRRYRPREILELGSGISTVVLAHALVANAADGSPLGRITSMEEDLGWHHKATACFPPELARAADFVHSPKVDGYYKIFLGVQYASIPERPYDLREYLIKGGNVAVVYDAGIKAAKGHFLRKAILSNITGINYITYHESSEGAYTMGYVKIGGKESLDFFQLPSGKIDDGLLLGGYAYGKLEYPVARNELIENIPQNEIYASVVTLYNEKFPALVMRPFGRGKVMYVNLPLGHLKAHSDDLPMRSILRTFLFKVVKMPHLLNTYQGKGGLVINWHIDANSDWKSITMMLEKNYLREGLQYSMHITAGDFRDEPGDARAPAHGCQRGVRPPRIRGRKRGSQ